MGKFAIAFAFIIFFLLDTFLMKHFINVYCIQFSNDLNLDFCPECGFSSLISSSLTGHELLSELQQRRFNGSEGGGGGTAWSPMDDELLAQPQVMKLLDSLREQYTKYQEVCRQRSKRSQLEEIQTKVMQVKHWAGRVYKAVL